MPLWTKIAVAFMLPLAAAAPADAQEIPAGYTTSAPVAKRPTAEPPIALSPPGAANTSRVSTPGKPGEARNKPASGLNSLLTMLGSLIVVLAIFLAATWVLRKSMPAGAQMLPREVVESLGRTPLAGRQHAHLLRCGNKLILVAVTAGGAETLTEITDPVEVDRLSGLCRAAQPQSSTDTFRQIFQQFGRDKTPRGFLGRKASQAELADAGTLAKGGDNDA